MSLLKVSNLQKKYKARTVVHDVSFDVGSGEASACSAPRRGQDHLFYMIVGLVPPTAARSPSTTRF
jgi:lipopolysaccharide export system ATP-binding protein